MEQFVRGGWVEGAPFVVKSPFSLAYLLLVSLGKWVRVGVWRKQPLIIPKAVIHLMDRDN